MYRGSRGYAISSRTIIALALLLIVAALSAGAAMAGISTSLPTNTSTNQVTSDLTADQKIAPDLLARFNTDGADAQVRYWVLMADQADTTNNIPNSQWSAKGWYVYDRLVEKAQTTQRPLLDRLSTLQSAGNVTAVESFWIINLIGVTGDLSSVQAMAADASVAAVKLPLDGFIHYQDSSSTDLSPEAQAVVDAAVKDVAAASRPLFAPFVPLIVQHNLNEVHAPQAWSLGYDGAGVVIGQMDTGVRGTHEALAPSYRGNVAPPDPGNIHDYNWYDGYLLSATPVDLNGHGSHTMGTALGISPNATYGNIGVAKGATWMSVRICAYNGANSCDGDAIMRGFQWTLAPTRVGGLDDPRPDLRPRVSNNSWGGGACDEQYNQAVSNWVNAGIFPAFSTGNSGPGAGTVGSPASAPDAWGTGNLNTALANWVINTSSSRGPSPCDGSIRPQAVAPGTNICSATGATDTSYSCGYTGTSMSAPHVTGAVAIMAQKNNELSPDEMTFVLTSTAFFSPTWGTLPNNNYGWGLIQIDTALNAINVGPTATATVTGTPPTAVPTATGTPTACVPEYTMATATATIIPATNDLGNSCDDCVTALTFPFPVTFYGSTYTDAHVSSNGNLQFTDDVPSTGNGTFCMPKAQFGPTIFLLHSDLRTDETTCPGGCGIFTETIGTAPNRVFVVEWRVTYFSASGSGNAEILFYENDPDMISLVYGETPDAGLDAVSGVQYDGYYGPYTEFSCGEALLTNGLRVDFTAVDNCPVATVTVEPSVTSEPTGSVTAQPTSTACVLQFTDVPEGSTFYSDIRCLACRGIINGYTTGCETGNPCFRPGNLVTRGQLAKIVANAANFSEPATGQQYEDVPEGSTFYEFIWRLTDRGLVNGYECGGVGEPCGDPALPYFRPNANVTRGQLAKIVANGAGLTEPVEGQQYEDVAIGSTFYEYIGRLSALGVINGYPCGGPGEPCGDPALPYFRPGNNATRGQASKIVANTFFPGCETP